MSKTVWGYTNIPHVNRYSTKNMRKCAVEIVAVLLVVGTVAGCGDDSSSSPTASTSELPATQTMTVLPFDPAAVTLISPFTPSHTGINVYTITGGHFLSPGTGIVTNIELNTGNGLPGGSNYGIRIHLTSTGLYAWYHFEVNGSISDQTQRDNILVALGDQVTAGQHIGNLVSLGKNAHVHFDMLDAGGRDAVQCPLVYFSPAVATTWESLYDAKIRERDRERIENNRGSVPSLPNLCNEVDLPISARGRGSCRDHLVAELT